ncbi:DMT family transporter [Vibrio brasiliensis]|uniref:DMT family transporter n=1 Tax=Vibrio brasiliensis TaxID=170652 RepID=UPI001EFC6889|nr:DMT family transporter [Vibrio brasiliensis]MCG9749919.1 DMT family transporter [Vibrio brasiliensis]MCG9781840.1 DMT family transporter [Vibrio brasiliensis]
MGFQGEMAAIGAAIAWAVATWIYSQFSHRFSALQLNVVKGVIASAMMLMVLPFEGAVEPSIETQHLIILAVSGVVGIAIGDSAYFASLKRIGANKTLLLESLAPPLSGVLALLALGSVLSVQSWLGVVVTTLAVTFVIFQPSEANSEMSWSGVAFGLLASVCQASGVVISHYALVAGDLPPLLGAFIRLTVGVLAVMVVINLFEANPYKGIKQHLKELTSGALLWLIGAIFVGTFLALWLQQVALKHANPAIAQTLIATSPLFILIIYLIKGQRVSAKSALGTLVAVGGISLFFVQ